ncbi:MAG: bestrophin family ion channel [Niabella sp.]
MVFYNPKDWFTYIFRFHKADTFRQLGPLMLAIAAYTGIIAYLELEYWQLSANNYVKNIPIMHNLLGFAISMLLVFRTNTAYDRWWEGRKMWGSLTNSSRNLAQKLSAILSVEDADNRNFFRSTIPAYALALHNHLHSEETRFALFDEKSDITHKHLYHHIDDEKHVPNQISLLMAKKIQELYRSGTLSGEQLLFVNHELQNFTDVCGACERIKNTPIPYSYSVFIKKFIFVYVMTLPFGFVFNLGYYAIPIVAFIFYVLASLEVIAEEIEDPFGGDPNDIPTEKIAQNISKHVAELI